MDIEQNTVELVDIIGNGELFFDGHDKCVWDELAICIRSGDTTDSLATYYLLFFLQEMRKDNHIVEQLDTDELRFLERVWEGSLDISIGELKKYL